MADIKAGDIVRCIDPTRTWDRLEKDATYVVTYVSGDGDFLCLDGVTGGYASDRFDPSLGASAAPMTLDAYQAECMRTAGDRSGIRPMAMGGLGIAGEAGEVADIIKKHLFHDHDLDVAELGKELGDVLWYVSSIAAAVGLSLEDVAKGNIEKLRKRYPDGWDPERSKNRGAE